MGGKGTMDISIFLGGVEGTTGRKDTKPTKPTNLSKSAGFTFRSLSRDTLALSHRRMAVDALKLTKEKNYISQ
jgi:hypothetical protein